ncbi:MAG: hypothetical protein KDJ36_02230 [Hyphomicrobiaceae bacterium]|nr:hypothetical protein [Hyphomicrobiaceae bacterium]
MTTEGTFDYDALSQEAMRGVVRTVLIRTAKIGLPGEHHFYVSFDTQAPGVVLSKRLREKYPGEMTIVLQHRFWDLIVTDERFEVKLTFDGIPERLVIPFGAIKVFYDPSVRFGLQFEPADASAEPDIEIEQMPTRPVPLAAAPVLTPVPSRRPADATSKDAGDAKEPAAAEVARSGDRAKEGGASADSDDKEVAAEDAGAGAQIVSLDHFRKK